MNVNLKLWASGAVDEKVDWRVDDHQQSGNGVCLVESQNYTKTF